MWPDKGQFVVCSDNNGPSVTTQHNFGQDRIPGFHHKELSVDPGKCILCLGHSSKLSVYSLKGPECATTIFGISTDTSGIVWMNSTSQAMESATLYAPPTET